MNTENVQNNTFKNILIFCFLGLSLVFPPGLLMLFVGPTRMIANKAASRKLDPNPTKALFKK